jgi:hypothetical protein
MLNRRNVPVISRLTVPLHPDDVGRKHIRRVADQEQRVKDRRLQVQFEQTDVLARQSGPERKPFLGNLGPLA